MNIKLTHDTSIVFSKENCSFCTRVKDLLNSSNIFFEERDIIKNEQFREQLSYLAKRFLGNEGHVTVPQIWLNGIHIGGYDKLSLMLGKESELNTPLVCPIE